VTSALTVADEVAVQVRAVSDPFFTRVTATVSVAPPDMAARVTDSRSNVQVTGIEIPEKFPPLIV
jgi:hypothetical protein